MNKTFLAVVGAIVVVSGIVANSAMFTVHQASQALVLQFGDPIRVVRKPGLKFKLPFVQNVEYYDRRILDLDPPAQVVLLSDQKRIIVDSFARYRIVDPLEFRKKAVTDANFRQVFGGQLNSAVRSEVAKVAFADMLTGQRVQVMERITKDLKKKALDYGVDVVDVRIGRTDLPKQTSQAVYNRMRSSRVAQAAELRAKGDEMKAKIEAKANRDRTIILAEAKKTSQILRGEGEGTKTRILVKAFGKDKEFFAFYRSMEAYGAALGGGTTMVLSPNSDFLRFFNRMSGGDSAKK